MGQCGSSAFCPLFRKEGHNRYTEFVPSKSWRYGDDHIRSQLQGPDEAEDEDEASVEEEIRDDLDTREHCKESSGLLEVKDEGPDGSAVDKIASVDTTDDDVDRFEVECITSPPQPQASDGPHTVHRPATDVHV